MHVFGLLHLPFSIRTFEYEYIEKHDEYTHDDREECCDLGTSSECHRLEVNNISGKFHGSDQIRREFLP